MKGILVKYLMVKKVLKTSFRKHKQIFQRRIVKTKSKDRNLLHDSRIAEPEDVLYVVYIRLLLNRS